LYNKKGNYNEAAAQFAKAASGLPQKNANMYNNEAVALYMAGRNDEAIAAYRDVLEIDPNFWAAYRNLGTALQKAGKFQDAVTSFEAALRLNSQAIDIYNDLANSYLRLDQKPQAIAALEHGLQLAQAAGDTENMKKLSTTLQANR
jgi:tetratricopeptide (TPR) repeat protein